MKNSMTSIIMPEGKMIRDRVRTLMDVLVEMNTLRKVQTRR
jgi:hypothetical protein